MNRPAVRRLLKPLAAIALITASVSCGPVKSVERDAPASDIPVSASTRGQALEAIRKDFVKQGTRIRNFRGGANDGWIEELKFISLEEVKTENLKGGKSRMIVRETHQVSRWKTYNGKKKGEAAVRKEETLHNYIF